MGGACSSHRWKEKCIQDFRGKTWRKETTCFIAQNIAVLAVMNLGFPLNSENFLTSCDRLASLEDLCSKELHSLLHSSVTLCLLCPNILLSTLFSNFLSLRSSLNVSDQVLHPYETTGKTIVLHILSVIYITPRRSLNGWLLCVKCMLWKCHQAIYSRCGLNTGIHDKQIAHDITVVIWSMVTMVYSYTCHLSFSWMRVGLCATHAYCMSVALV